MSCWIVATALQVRTRDIRFVQALLEQGAIANSKEPVTLTTPLHAAFQSNLAQVRCFAACAQPFVEAPVRLPSQTFAALSASKTADPDR